MNTQFDLIAIGGGSGGLAVAERAAAHGKRVAIIDASPLGGTCVNQGCVPKKVMWYGAHLTHAAHDAIGYGAQVQMQGFDWQKLIQGRQAYTEAINHYWSSYTDALNITHIQGWGKLVDAHHVAVGDTVYQAEHIVLAMGSRPIVPPVAGAELGITSDGFFQLQQRPDKVAIIGAGYIGVELAGVLNALGAKVTVIGLENRPLELFDEGLSTALADSLQRQGIELQMGFAVAALSQQPTGIRVSSRTETHLDGFDTVIWAVGRRPNTDNLGLENAGLQVPRSGIIATDEYQNTAISNIYALGDIAGRSPLTPVAVDAGRKLADRLFGGKTQAKVDYAQIPTVVFTHPPIGSIGMTEAQAKQQHEKISIYETQFTPMRYALNTNGLPTFMKMICAGDEQRVIGLHLLGEGVDEMLQGFAVAIKMGATKQDFDNTMAIHPSSAEELVTLKQPSRVFENAALMAA